jgi:hypothetical protein
MSSRTKESRYLIDPGYPLYNPKSNFLNDGLEGYARLFPDANVPGHCVHIEATPDYMYQKTALSVLATLPTSPIVVFILRNPVDRILSLFGYASNNVGSVCGKRSARDFFIASRDGIGSGDDIIDSAVSHSVYHHWLGKWMEIVDRSRIHIVFFEELASYPASVMQSLCSRLRLDGSFYRNFAYTVENPTYRARSSGLTRARRMVERHAPSLMRLGTLKTFYRAVNVRERLLVTAWDEELRSEIRQHFVAPNRQLQHLLGRNLPPGWI